MSALFLPWFFMRSWGFCFLQVGRMQIMNKDGKEAISVSDSHSLRQTSHILPWWKNRADGSPQRDNLYFLSKLTNIFGRRWSKTFSMADRLHHGVTTGNMHRANTAAAALPESHAPLEGQALAGPIHGPDTTLLHLCQEIWVSYKNVTFL